MRHGSRSGPDPRNSSIVIGTASAGTSMANAASARSTPRSTWRSASRTSSAAASAVAARRILTRPGCVPVCSENSTVSGPALTATRRQLRRARLRRPALDESRACDRSPNRRRPSQPRSFAGCGPGRSPPDSRRSRRAGRTAPGRGRQAPRESRRPMRRAARDPRAGSSSVARPPVPASRKNGPPNGATASSRSDSGGANPV